MFLTVITWKKISKQLLWSVQIMTAALVFASYGIRAKVLPVHFNIWFESALKWLLISSILIVVIHVGKIKLLPIKKQDVIWFVLSCVPWALVYSLYSLSFKYVTVGLGNLLFFWSMVLTNALIGNLLYKDDFWKKEIIWLLLVVVWLSLSVWTNMSLYLYGIIGGIWAWICWSFRVCFTKRISSRYHVLQIALITFIVLAGINLCVTAISEGFHAITIYELGSIGAVSICLLIWTLCTIWWYNRISPNVGGIVWTSEILFGILYGYIFFRETLSIYEIVGACCIIWGIVAQFIPERAMRL